MADPTPTRDQVAVSLGKLLGKSFSNFNDFFSKELRQGHFLGTLIGSIHQDLQDKLTAAENALTSQGFQQPPGSIYKIGGGDPLSGGHRWGLAVDINYDSNPYIMHENGEASLDEQLFGVYERICFLMLYQDHSVINYNINLGVPAGFTSVTDAYTKLAKESQAMKDYFSFLDNDAKLNAYAQNWNAMTPTRVRVDPAVWKERIRSDYQILGGILDGKPLAPPPGTDRPFVLKGGASLSRRDPKLGFLDMPQQVVEALSAQGFIWGAIGFGPESGDVMHFDLRSGTYYSQVKQAWKDAKAAL